MVFWWKKASVMLLFITAILCFSIKSRQIYERFLGLYNGNAYNNMLCNIYLPKASVWRHKCIFSLVLTKSNSSPLVLQSVTTNVPHFMKSVQLIEVWSLSSWIFTRKVNKKIQRNSDQVWYTGIRLVSRLHIDGGRDYPCALCGSK